MRFTTLHDLYLQVDKIQLWLPFVRKMVSPLRAYLVIIFIFLGLNFTSFATAQSVSDYVKISKPDNWVDVDAVEEGDFVLAEDLQIGYQLLSYQTKILPDDRIRYRRFVKDMYTQGGVEDNGTITITFDPTYQTIEFHALKLIRNGKSIDLLNLEQFEIYRVETDRDKLLYNGDLQIGFAVPGLQVGDQIDYSYSLQGMNSALVGSYYDRQVFEYNVPVRKLRNRLLIDKSLEINTRTHNNPPKPIETELDNFKVLDWLLTDLKAQTLDDNAPAWFYSRPTFETSGVGTWKEVGEHFFPYYFPPTQLSPELKSIISKISGDFESQNDQTRAALEFVQSNIRYLGIELGEGGFIPREPELVLERRFGDCKDVTFLLLTLLKNLGVEANPLLVNTDERGGFEKALPGYTAFDHVIVRAVIEGESYYLDATRGEQLGDLDHLDQGSFQKGLLLDGSRSRVITADESDLEWRKDFLDEYDLVSHSNNVTFTTTASYFGQNADWTKSYVESDGMDSIEKQYLDYFADFYPTIEILKPSEITFDNQTSKFEIKSFYVIKDAWDIDEVEGTKTFWAIPYEISGDMPKFLGAKRTSPLSLAYPKKTRQRLRFKVEEDWTFDLEPTSIENQYIDYQRVHSFENSVYEESYSYLTKQDHLSATGFSEIMNEIELVRDDFGVLMTMPAELETEGWENWSEETWGMIYLALLLTAGALASIGLIFNRDYDLAWRDQVVLHPVSVKKFVFLSFLTIGHYQIYWFYKNWQWVKTVMKEEIWPIPRAIFAGIMNFSLFPRIDDIGAEKEKKGYNWYRFLALPLAFLYFFSGIYDRAVERIDTIPEWATIISFVLLILPLPVLLQVNKYNEDKPEIIARHSRFSIFTWGLIVIYAPIALLVYFGLSVILFELF